MRKILSITFLTLAACQAVSAENANNNLYVVDVQKVINDSAQGKAARDIIEGTVRKEGEKLKQLELSLKKLEEDIAKQSSLLSGEALSEKQEQYRKKEREIANMYEDQKRSIELKNRAEIGKVVQQVDKIIKNIAKDQGYNFIIEKDPRVVVYASTEYDITDSVIEALNN